jgi:hypothetical protein
MFSGLVPTSQPVPNWAVASALGAPVALVTSTSLATLLPTTPYDPFGQTLSVLAATPRSAPVMTIGFVLTAMCQIATAAGLHVLRPAPRVLLAFERRPPPPRAARAGRHAPRPSSSAWSCGALGNPAWSRPGARRAHGGHGGHRVAAGRVCHRQVLKR